VERYNVEQSFADLRAGVISAVVLNGLKPLAQSWGMKFKKDEPFTPFDFGLPFLQEPEVESHKSQVLQEHDLFLRVQAMNKADGGKEVKNA